MSDDQPVLPYGEAAPNSGFSGSETSEARARRQDSDGTTGKRQRQVLDLLWERGDAGLTWPEGAKALRLHHGAISGALSTLNKAGRIERLTLVRNNCKVYVHPDFVNGRTIERNRGTSTTRMLDEFAALVRDRVPQGCPLHPADLPVRGCWSCDANILLARHEARG